MRCEAHTTGSLAAGQGSPRKHSNRTACLLSKHPLRFRGISNSKYHLSSHPPLRPKRLKRFFYTLRHGSIPRPLSTNLDPTGIWIHRRKVSLFTFTKRGRHFIILRAKQPQSVATSWQAQEKGSLGSFETSQFFEAWTTVDTSYAWSRITRYPLDHRYSNQNTSIFRIFG